MTGDQGQRPLRARIWYYRPGAWEPGWRIIQRGGDEYDWHTIVIGSCITGAVVFATRPCTGTGRCAERLDFGPLRSWPADD